MRILLRPRIDIGNEYAILIKWLTAFIFFPFFFLFKSFMINFISRHVTRINSEIKAFMKKHYLLFRSVYRVIDII